MVAGCTGSVSDSVEPTPGTPSVTANDGDTTRTNNLYLEPVDDSIATSFTWTEGSYQITSDQESTWKGVTNCAADAGDTCQIVVEAGRSASTEPAQWFAGLAPVAIFTNGWSTSKTEPEELNFSISGTLTINGTSYPVAIGQGSYVMSGTDNNNWWIGGSGWTDLGTVIVSPDRQFWITGSSNNAVFGIGSGVPPDSAPTPAGS